MKRRMGLGFTLALCAVAEAAEPVVTPPAESPAAATPAAATPASTPVPAKPAVTKPLDLTIGDVRKYMMPNDYRATLAAPDAEKNTVVVEAKRELLAVDYEKAIPVGPLMPLWWGLTHPTQSWRILVPDINRPPDGPPDVVPPPIFRWGP